MANTNIIHNLLIQGTEINTKSFVCSDENTTIILPRRIRYYLDSYSNEFNEISIDKKMCELGVAITRGINLYSVIKEDIKRHKESPQYNDYEMTAKHSLCSYIDFLRETDNALANENYFKLKDVELLKITNLLEEEILLRYFEYPTSNKDKILVSYTSIALNYDAIQSSFELHSEHGLKMFKAYVLTSHESIKKSIISKQYIMYLNRWLDVKDELSGYNLYFDKELIYPGDEKYIKTYNNLQRNNPHKQLVLQIPPEPWSANILNSKLVLLSMNPGYVEHLNKNLANMFSYQYAEEIMEDKRCMLAMEGRIFDMYEPTRILGDYYWRKILSRLGEEVYGKKDMAKIFSQVALCQYIAYSSNESIQMKEILPSQKFTKMVLLYLVTSRKDVKFLILRASKQWKQLLGDGIWNYLLENDRLFISKHPRTQSISKNNIGSDSYRRIVNFLKKIS